MTPEQLKASILQYAIQGKLVEQRPEEGTAEELYQQIQAEKQRLVKEGKIQKENPLPEIAENEIPFDIPESWKWTKLNDLVIKNIKRGKSPTYVEQSTVQVFAQKCNIKTGGINMGLAKYLDEHKLDKYPDTEFMQNGDVVINSTGGGTMGRVGLFEDTDRENNMRIVPDSHITTIRSNAFVYYKYLFYVLKNYQSYLETQGEGSTNQTELKPAVIMNLLVPLPPFAEQKRIVSKIEELLPLVDRYAAAYEKLEQFNAKFPEDMKKSVLQYAIQGKLVEQRAEEGTGEELYQQIQAEKQRLIKDGKIKKEKPLPEIAEDEIPFDIPGNWKWVRLGSVVSVYGGKRIPVGRKLTIEDTGYAYIRVSDMKDGYVSTENLQFVPQDIYPSISRYIIGKEDVFITVAGTIGRVGKIPPELDGANLTENADRLVFSQLDQTWLIKCLQSSVVQSQIIDATTKVGQPKLAIVRIQNMMIPLPPLAEQKRIVAKLEEILPLCERLK